MEPERRQRLYVTAAQPPNVSVLHMAMVQGAVYDDATSRDENWLPLIANPPYPEYPSGHLGLSGSICKTLQQFFGTDKLAWSDTNVAGRTRSYTRVSDAVEEIVDVRIWSGIHFRKADEDAERIGRRIAKYRAKHYFERLEHD